MAEALQSRSLSNTAIITFFWLFPFSLRCEGRKHEISSPESGVKGVTAVSQHGTLSYPLSFPMAGSEINSVEGRRWVSAGSWLYCWYLNFSVKQNDVDVSEGTVQPWREVLPLHLHLCAVLGSPIEDCFSPGLCW